MYISVYILVRFCSCVHNVEAIHSLCHLRVLTRILKIGVKMVFARKIWSFTILFYWHFEKVRVRIKKLE